ncbi:efflux RND transporter periplasmic adaptor subunit [Parasediminibacterium paludis]|uniref:Efflux RND transporter periplasmic adaptor subunit n=1 Tax=Parasediminibacterium paludis TaxID=908966 RepID=A0ABV8PZ48_9BACT
MKSKIHEYRNKNINVMSKNIFLVMLSLFIAITSCKNKANETKAEPTIKDTTANKEEHHETEVTLTDDQIKAIGLQTGSIEQRNLKSTLKVNGKLTLPPQNQAQVSMLTGGIVKTINVTEGTFVKQGQTLATIVNNEVIQLQQDYLENNSQLTYLQAEFKRQTALQEDRINATKTLQQVQNELGVAQAKQRGLQTKLQVLGINAANISTANFTNHIAVTAPISGFIHHINLTMGKFADANSILFDIVDNRFLHLDLTLFEKDISKVKIGDKIMFTDANDASHTHPATIFALNKSFEDKQQAIIAHAKIEEQTETLLPGMYVEARIQIDNYKANALPDDAVVSNGDEHYIYVEIKKNHYKQIAVAKGVSDLGFTEIKPLEEIPAKAIVVIKGAYYLLSQLTKGSGEE